MRILQVGSGMPGWAGTEKYIIDLSMALRQRGHEVTVGCARGSVLEGKCVAFDIPHVQLEMRRTMDWRRFPSLFNAMRGKYDVVNIHGYRDYVLPPAAARLARVPAVVMTRHLSHSFKTRARAWACARIFYDHIVAVSRFVEGVLVDSGVSPERVTIVHNGVGPALMYEDLPDIREEFAIPPGSFLIAAAGRIEANKGFEVLVRAMRQLDGHCIICGRGVGLAGLRELVRTLDLQERVHLPGFRDDVPRLWRDASVAVVCSISSESFPYTALEALSAGTPVVASDTGGIPEICTPECSMLVTPGDSDQLAAAIRGLQSSSSRLCAMRAAARLRASMFTLERMAAGIEAVYMKLLNRAGAVSTHP
ncbi:MAG: glycosyltransferase family 4 protein [Thermoguttaceae bacterium]